MQKAALGYGQQGSSPSDPLAPLYPEVAFEMAQVQLLSGDLNASSEWASNAVAADTGSQRGMRINLLARILFLKGKLTEAEIKVREALLLNRENGLRGEEANSLRTLGDIQSAGKAPRRSCRILQPSPRNRQNSWQDRKIAADLRALAALALFAW